MMMGDLNVNANLQVREAVAKQYALIEKDAIYQPILPLIRDPYGCQIKAFKSKEKQYTLIDLLRESEGEGKFNPVTFADVIIDSKGKEFPMNPEVFGKGDWLSKQALDYIFLVLPENINHKQNLAVNIQKTKVEKLLMKDEAIPCGQCSDHFGISTVID